MEKETVDAIGVWTLRIGLLIGAIVSGLLGNYDVSGLCAAGLVCSFFCL